MRILIGCLVEPYLIIKGLLFSLFRVGIMGKEVMGWVVLKETVRLFRNGSCNKEQES